MAAALCVRRQGDVQYYCLFSREYLCKACGKKFDGKDPQVIDLLPSDIQHDAHFWVSEKRIIDTDVRAARVVRHSRLTRLVRRFSGT